MINKKDRTAEQLAQAAGVAAMSSAAAQRVDVKKWVSTSSHGGMVSVVTNAPEHTYVKWPDYAALLQKLAELERVARANRDGFEEYERRYYLEKDRAESAEAKLAERDAEIARLGEELDVANTALGQATTDCVEASFRAEAAERAREELQEALNETEGQLSALGESYAEIYLAMEEAHGLLRDVIAWHRTVPIDETPNRKDGGIFGRIAAFLAANGGRDE